MAVLVMARRGYVQRPISHGEAPFLVWGRPCLDFANTVSWRRGSQRDRMQTYGDLLTWAVVADALDETQAGRLAERAAADPPAAEAAYALAVALREAIYRACAAIADGGSAPT